ncbi:PHP domain-containing protein [Paenibacillus hodogayensis]|uniref:PHP domain-containing protein n=1 Tax=Paenibacillus hodogayensis TaxID=279208 RepID=A0ABV5VS83_9BACL
MTDHPTPAMRMELHVLCPGSESSADAWIEQAARSGRQALRLVSRSGIEWFPGAERTARRCGIKPIFGFELLVSTGHDDVPSYPCRIYVKNDFGRKHLYKLVSLSCPDRSTAPQAVSTQTLEKLRERLLLSSGFPGSELLEAALLGARDQAERIAGQFDAIEIQPFIPDSRSLSSIVSEEVRLQTEEAHRLLADIADKLGKPLLAGCTVGESAGDTERFGATDDPITGLLGYLGPQQAYAAVVDHPNRFADLIEEFELMPKQLHLPVVEGAEQFIRTKCTDRAAERYGQQLPRQVAVRLDWELERITAHGFAAPYILAADTAAQSRADGCPVETRGSAGASLVAHLLGLTETNPLPPHYVCEACSRSEWPDSDAATSGFDFPDRSCPVCGSLMKGDGHNIPAEMFLGLNGNIVPDLDLLVPEEYQERALDGLGVRFGKERALRVSRISGGLYPGGVVLVPEQHTAEQFTPVYDFAPGLPDGWRMAHFDYRDLETALLKLDVFPHSPLSMLRLLHRLTGVDPSSIPMNDPRVLSLFRSPAALGVTAGQIRTEAATYGIPEMGLPFVRAVLEETKPAAFSDLLRISGLTHGTGVWENNARELIRSRTCTISAVIACRDDIMLELTERGIDREQAFRIAEGVRKGKGLCPSYIVEMRGAGIAEWYIESCRRIGYLFPRAHAVTYVASAIRHAYYKLYRPLEFYAAYFTVYGPRSRFAPGSGRYEDIWERVEQAESNPGDSSAAALAALEVAMEMTARGFRFGSGDASQDAAFAVEDDDRRLLVTANPYF